MDSCSQKLNSKIEKLIDSGWKWKYIEGVGNVLESPHSNETFGMRRLEDGRLVPDFLKNEQD